MAKLQVKDEGNCRFLLKFMATVGLTVPKTAVPEKALVEVATLHNLLGDGATLFEIEALDGILSSVFKVCGVFLRQLII